MKSSEKKKKSKVSLEIEISREMSLVRDELCCITLDINNSPPIIIGVIGIDSGII